MPVKALRVCVPTSITGFGSGSSVSINKNGSISFSSITSLRINGVFSSTYDNYMMVSTTSVAGAFDLRFKLSKNTVESSSSYGYQYLYINGTSQTAARSTTTIGFTMNTGVSGSYGGSTDILYGPYLNQPTAHSSFGAAVNSNNPAIYDWAEIHTISDTYDGILILPDSASPATGIISIYGWVK